MMRCWLRGLAALYALLAAVILLLRLLAYDAGHFAALRQSLLAAPGCQRQSCYLGIRPGGSTMRAALALLNESPAVFHVHADFYTFDSATPYAVSWQADHPYFPQGRLEAQYQLALVDFIWLPTTLTLGEFWLAFGPPRSITIYPQFQVLRYGTFAVQSAPACTAFWWQPAEVIVSAGRTPPHSVPLPRLRPAACQAARS